MSETLTNGVIVPDKGSRDWYADLRSNWLKLDSLMAGGNITINPAQTEGVLVATITVGGKEYKLYQQDGDVSVKIDPSSENAEYPLVASTSAEANTGSVVMAPTVTVNPSTGAVTATSFKGKLEGNASTATTATKAVQDGTGAVIADTYATKSELGSKADDANVVHKSGAETIVGAKTFSGEVQTNTIKAVGGGANISLTSSDNGGFAIRAYNGTVNKELVGYPDGMLAWDNNEILTRVNGVTLDTQQLITGKKVFVDNEIIIKNTKKQGSEGIKGSFHIQDSEAKNLATFSYWAQEDKGSIYLQVRSNLANDDAYTRFYIRHPNKGSPYIEWNSTLGIPKINVSIIPRTETLNLGDSSSPWGSVYAKAVLVKGANVITENNQIMLAKNLSGTSIKPGGVVDCGNGNGNLKQWYLGADGTFALANTLPTGIWKSTSFVTLTPNEGGIFIKLS